MVYKFLVVILSVVVIYLVAQSQEESSTDEPTLVYTQYVDIYKSHIVQQQRHETTPDLMFLLEYPGTVEGLVASSLHGLYYLMDDDLFTRDDDTFTAQWSLPPVKVVTDLESRSVNPEDFEDLNGSIITNDIVLSPLEDFVAYDLTTLNENGELEDEFIVLYERQTALFRLIEIEDQDLNTIHIANNLRWSPDGQLLAYAYPAQDRVDTEHITIVSDCTMDITLPCIVDRFDLPDKMPFMRTFDWSPDGTQFAYSCSDTHLEPHEICVVNVDGTGLQEYITSESYKSDLHWSPDGRTLAYVGHPPGHQEQDIYLFDLKTGEEFNFSSTPDVLESAPFWLKYR